MQVSGFEHELRGRLLIDAGGAAIHVTPDSRDAGKAIPIKLFQSQAGVEHQSIDAAVEMATAGQDVLQGVEPILPAGDEGIVAAAVLQEQKAAIWLQDPANVV